MVLGLGVAWGSAPVEPSSERTDNGDGGAEAGPSGSFELRIAAPLRAAAATDPRREAELRTAVAWTAAGDFSGDGAGFGARVEDARRDATAWLGQRRPAELVEVAARDALRTVIEQALFPNGEGRVDAVAIEMLRLR